MAWDRTRTNLIKRGFVGMGMLLAGAIVAILIMDYMEQQRIDNMRAPLVNSSVVDMTTPPDKQPPEEIVHCINGFLYTVRYGSKGELIYAHPVSETTPQGYRPVPCTPRDPNK